MSSIFSWFLPGEGYLPHAICLAWQPGLIALHAASDTVIALSYYSIPLALIYFVSKRSDLVFRGLFILTSVFILACGTTHLMGALVLWYPVYRLDGLIKLITAVVSVAAAFEIWRVMPAALALPSVQQLEHANQLLAQEANERRRAEEALREANALLESRVARRTAELEKEIEQRRHAEQTLRASEERWRDIFESSAVGIAVADQEYRLITVNPALQRMTGYSGQEVETLGLLDITHEEDRDTTRATLDGLMYGQHAHYQTEQRWRRKDGRTMWVRLSAAQTPDPQTAEPGLSALVEDITERKQTEDALQQTREALNHASRLTTMGELLASISHEVNQPLAAIIANGDACLRMLDSAAPSLPDLIEATEEVISDARRASDVIQHVRSLMKRSVSRQAKLDVNDIVIEVLALLRHQLQAKRVTTRLTLDENLPSVLADRVELQQVLLNLAMNGIEAMEGVSQQERILLVRSRLDDVDTVTVDVEDSGIGVSPDTSEQIFASFFSTKPAGMGMGLAISRSIIEQHRGKLWVTAGEHQGARFHFSLPAAAMVEH